MNDENELNKLNPPVMDGYTKIPTFKLWVANRFPYMETDFDALTNYELLTALVDYLNNVIKNEENVESNVAKLNQAYLELLNYVKGYFNNLDVQEEINNKLDDLVKDGTLTRLIKKYVDPFINEMQQTIDNQNTTIENINAKVSSAVSGSPIAVSSTSLMTDTSRIYILTTNGYWYYYNGSEWTQGGIYQSSVSNDDVIYLEKKDNSLNYNVPIRYNITMKDGYRLTQSEGIEFAAEGYSCSPFIPYDGVYKNRFFNVLDGTIPTELIAFYDKDYTFISYIPLYQIPDKINLIEYPSNTKYLRFCLTNDHIDGDVYVTQNLLSNRRINELNGYLNELDLVNVFDKNIKTNYEIGEVVSLTPESSKFYKYIILDCESNDVFAINGKGGINPRLWAFIDAENKLLEKSVENKEGLEIVVAPTNAKKLICNFNIGNITPVETWDSFYVYNLSKANIETIMNGYNLVENTGVTNQNIKTNYDVGEVVSLTPESVSNYTYIVVNCKATDKFVVSGHGGINPRLWAFIDSSNHLLMKSNANKAGTEVITAPTGASKLICNFQTTYDYSLYNYNQLAIKNLNSRLDVVEENTAISNYTEPFPSPENSGCCYIRSLKTARDIANYLTDFKKPSDLMCHVGTFKIINGNVYVTYYGSETSTGEDPTQHIVRFVSAPLNNLSNKTFYTIQKVGDTFDGHSVTAIYDTILMTINNDDLYIMWTCQLDGVYTRLYQVYNITNDTFGEIQYNYFKVNNTTSIFNTTNMKNALDDNNIPHKEITIDIGLMQKLTSHIENGTTYYYTGCYAGKFNCIVKSTNLITWEYVSAPTFTDNSLFENACYVKGDKVYYFIRQDWMFNYGLLSYYDLLNNTWHEPVKINDCQSRSDFFEDVYGNLYLTHANNDRNHITITRIDTNYLVFDYDRIDAYVTQSFYPYVDSYNNQLYMIYTQNRRHMYFSTFDLGSNDDVINNMLYNKIY